MAVRSAWAGQLVYRRKLYPAGLRSTLVRLYEWRIKADYQTQNVREREARLACQQARRMVEVVALHLGVGAGE